MKTNRQPRWILQITALCLLALASLPAMAQLEWPQEITADGGTIIVYQPQPESLDGNILRGRAAIALEIDGVDEPIFGAMWFSSRIETDQDEDIVTVLDFKVEQVTWPDSKDAGEQRFTAIVEGACLPICSSKVMPPIRGILRSVSTRSK